MVGAHSLCKAVNADSAFSFFPEMIRDSDGSSVVFKLDAGGGWVSRVALDGSPRRMCWLPHKRRHGGRIVWRGQKVVIGARSGLVTFLDFSDV
jgi:hypothetical protein